ncbi:MAG TPA: hypothetical protein VKQ52_07065, partial [Puia sp.]|nr:hypothetical protein [Puia sp.]
MRLKSWFPALLLTFFTSALTAQDSASIGLPELMAAEKLFDLRFTPAKRDSILSGLVDHLQFYRYLHTHNLYNDVPLSLSFDPLLPGTAYERRQRPLEWHIPGEVALPADRSELAWYSIPELSSLLRRRKITSVELTKFFIDR